MTTKLSRLEYQRQTGRTTRMFEEAKRCASVHTPVAVIMFDEPEVKMWEERMGKVEGLRILQATPFVLALLDIKTMTMNGPFARYKVFMDHSAIECCFRKFLEMWVAFDEPVQLTPERKQMFLNAGFVI